MALTRIPSSGLEGNITLGNVVISGSITNSLGQPYTTGGGGGAGGYTGSAGTTGFTGSSGTGFTGSAGTTGFTGSVGTTGFTGSKGDTGLGFAIAKSYVSVAALTADTSPTGIVAGQFAIIETGSVNDADNSKLYLWSGTAYSYVTDLSGAAGITGPAGATGPTGLTGTTGFTGSIGFTGSGGVGFTGSAGTDGSVGFTGSGGTGYTGSAGTDGSVGFTGSSGAGFTGSAGANGATGATGPQGLIGYTGSAGSGGGGGGSVGYTGSAGIAAIQEFVATAGQDTFAVSGGYTVGSVLVFVNGIQMNNNDYAAGDAVSVVTTEPRNLGDVVRVIFNMGSPSININDIKTFSVAMSIALGL